MSASLKSIVTLPGELVSASCGDENVGSDSTTGSAGGDFGSEAGLGTSCDSFAAGVFSAKALLSLQAAYQTHDKETSRKKRRTLRRFFSTVLMIPNSAFSLPLVGTGS